MLGSELEVDSAFAFVPIVDMSGDSTNSLDDDAILQGKKIAIENYKSIVTR